MALGTSEEIKSIERRLDGIIVSTGTASGSTTLGNGDQTVFTITTTSGSGAKVNVASDVTLYIGSVAAANQLPGGSAIDESQWQVIGPWNDWGATDNVNVKTLIYVRNISAGSQSVLLRTISRTIVNSPTPDQEGVGT